MKDGYGKYPLFEDEKGILDYYSNFSEKITDILDEQERWSLKEAEEGAAGLLYQLGGFHYGHILGKNHNKAAAILKKEYTADYPKNNFLFEGDEIFCYVYVYDRKQARQFLNWMNRKYFKPWVKAHKYLLKS